MNDRADPPDATLGDWRARILEPPLQTPQLPGTGGVLRRRPEDFVVEEVPAYSPNGQANAHALVRLTKRELSSEEAIVAVAEHLGLDRRLLGMAGRKDRVAVTHQWISVPAAAAGALASFEHPSIELGPPRAHGNKLRTGHLRGNRFTVVVRELSVSPGEATQRAEATLRALADDGGLANYFGPQRFGWEGRQLDRGLSMLRAGKAGRRGNLVVSAGQSALFNLYAQVRRERGLWRRVLAGDLLQKIEGGGMFECTEPSVDQARLDAGQLRITGPMFGSRMRAPSPDTDAAALEHDVLTMAGVEPAALSALGRRAAGTRRSLTVSVSEASTQPDDPSDASGLGPGLRLCFFLPAGSYATALCREVMTDDCGPSGL